MSRAVNVLVVDDNESHAESVAEGLSRDGYRTMTAHSGTEGQKLLRENPVHVVVTDMVMPDVNGMTILKTAHEQDPATAVILVTGHGTVESAVEALRQGAFHYLLKPLNLKELRRWWRRRWRN